MSICGIEFKASEANLVVLDGTKTTFSHLNVKPKKLSITNDLDSDEIRAFQEALFAFLRENKVELIAIKRRNKKGEFSGGPVGFKLEAIVQLYEGCQIIFLAAATISSAIRKNDPVYPTTLMKYQHKAFETCFATLS